MPDPSGFPGSNPLPGKERHLLEPTRVIKDEKPEGSAFNPKCSCKMDRLIFSVTCCILCPTEAEL